MNRQRTLRSLFAILSAVVLELPAPVTAQTADPYPATPAVPTANSHALPPAVQLDTYTAKPTHTFGFSGTGFAPGEPVDVYLSAHLQDPLTTVAADSRGDITSHDLAVPFIGPGNYSLSFVGRVSDTPVSVGFNIQGFHPWAILDNYYLAPHTGVGFAGTDFVPGEVVQVYLNSRLNDPVAQVTADANGRFEVRNAFSLPDVTGDNQLIFVGQQSQTEVTAVFGTVAPTPSTP